MQRSATDVILSAIADECEHSYTATLSENHLKVIAMNALLVNGFVMVEGHAHKNQGKRIWLGDDGKIKMEICERPSINTSPDIRVVSPEKLTVELQSRSIHGSQNTLFSHNILDDIQRLVSDRADLFVLACDLPIYNSLRGIKPDTRGRKAKAPLLFALLLPDANILTRKATTHHRQAFQVIGIKRPSVAGIDRVVVGIS